MQLLPSNAFVPPCDPSTPDPNESRSIAMITRTYKLTASDPFSLQHRLRVLREALRRHGGKITTMQWKNCARGKHVVKVRYVMPESLVPALCL